MKVMHPNIKTDIIIFEYIIWIINIVTRSRGKSENTTN